ncbi:hypothetical protein [Nitrosomonas sp. Nm58]|uniref:hypothetical protein n=1 Tax=Nitrosomonas sp. Nm58 TaxID=200126 RepID=UPI00089B9B70|nr:hypothetical protein [Nitrosomonas sp. Nm58]SDY63685.1 hypothetical protein SAMN05421754_10165 [Nitrosomonas sp. Nm58]
MDIWSMIFGLIVGVAIGAVGINLWNSYVNNQAIAKVNNLFEQLWHRHTHLFQEMKQDMDNPDYKFQREFYVLRKNQRFSLSLPRSCLVYFLEEHDDLEHQLKTLESYDLISNVTEPGKDLAKYQFNEKFVELLRRKNI